jgi:hypothetical protein
MPQHLERHSVQLSGLKKRYVIYARLATVQSDTGEYDSLLVEPGYTLTNWTFDAAHEGELLTTLDRLSMYPLLFADTLRMGFARVAETRITYIVKYVSFYKPLVVEEHLLGVETEFLKAPKKNGNIRITLSDGEVVMCTFWLRLSGYSCDVVHRRYRPECSVQIRSALHSKFFSSQSRITLFLHECFSDFHYEGIRVSAKNAREYFQDGRYRLSLIEYLGIPILLARKC